jgi:hypothetical protein
VVVHYGIDLPQMYLKFAEKALKLSCNLDILGSCHTLKGFAEGNFMPSWGPDWSISETTQILRIQRPHQQHFAATGEFKYCPKLSEDLTLLCLDGHLVDEITGIGMLVTRRLEQNFGFSIFQFLQREYQVARVLKS